MEQIKISEEDYKLAQFLKAIANPVRLSILKTLIVKSQCPHGSHPCTCGDKCEGENCKCGCKCGELVELCPVAQSTVSQHIKELKNAGLIRIEGRKGDYVICHDVLKEGLQALLKEVGYRTDGLLPAEDMECHCCHK